MTDQRSILIVTNDFPPRQGGIQSFVYEMTRRLPSDQVVVYTSHFSSAADFDAEQPFVVYRDRSSMLLPSRRVRRALRDVISRHGCDAVWYGAAAPLGLMAADLRAAGVRRQVATTHGHEVGWTMLPGGRRALRAIARNVDVLTYLGEFTRSRLAASLGDRVRLVQLTPGVDAAIFSPDVDADSIRQRYQLQNRRVVVCVSRLVPRKGQDVLIEAMPTVLAECSDAVLLLVGQGPDERRLRRLIRRGGLADHIVVTGGVSYQDLPAYFAAGDLFAMPCRTRRHGLDVEGLGIVYLEASAAELPVIVGDSGGAPDAVLPDKTGVIVNGRDVGEVASAIIALLQDPARAAEMGSAGRDWVQREWDWDTHAEQLLRLLTD